MTPTESAFEGELELFRREVDSAIQLFYASVALNGYAFKSKTALAALNDTPLFWNTVKGALQSSTWMVLGRIFDQKSPHNVDKLVQMTQRYSPSRRSRQGRGWRAQTPTNGCPII
jgi:hypothetical protein